MSSSNSAKSPQQQNWLQYAHFYLAHGNGHSLISARDTASDVRIRQFLSGVIDESETNMDPEASYLLADSLDSQGQHTEAAMVRLLVLSIVAELADKPEMFPEGQRDELYGVSFTACQECIDIAQEFGFPAVVARYMLIIGKGLVKLDKKALARSTCEESLHIYQKLAENEPILYKPYVADILVTLGDIMYEQRASVESKLAYEEARDIFKELSKKKPDTYAQYVAIVTDKLNTRTPK